MISRIGGSIVIGGAMVGVVAVSSSDNEGISYKTASSVMLVYPTVIMPTGVMMNSVIDRLTEYYTPYDYKKEIAENRHRMKNYMLNKRYMLIDLCMNQCVYGALLAVSTYYAMRLYEGMFDRLYTPREKQVVMKDKVTTSEWLTIVKVRVYLTVSKIINEFYFGYRDSRGELTSLKKYNMINKVIPLLYHAFIIQMFTHSLRGSSPPAH